MDYNHKFFAPDGSAVQAGRWQRRLVSIILWMFAIAQLAIYIWSIAIADWQLLPLKANPLLGVSRSKLTRVGATVTDKIRDEDQWWRLVSSPFVPAGVIHLWANCSIFWTFGGFLAAALGPWQLLLILALSGLAGSSVSANIATEFVTSAAGAPAFGLVGGTAAALILHRRLFQHHLISFFLLAFVLLVNLFIGATPFVDQSANIAGFVAGALATVGCLLLSKKGILGREWLLQLCSILSLCASLAITIIAVIGVAMDLPLANCCNRLVCTPTKLWDCDASRIATCTYNSQQERGSSDSVTMTCTATSLSFDFKGKFSDGELDNLCSLYCGSKYT